MIQKKHICRVLFLPMVHIQAECLVLLQRIHLCILAYSSSGKPLLSSFLCPPDAF